MSSGYLPPSILPTPTYLTATSLLGKPETPHEEATQPTSTNAKMFVGGLPQSVTQDSLREYFERFGAINEAFVLMDEGSGRSRGFGFVTFESPASLHAVLSSRPHVLDGKQVDCKHAVLKGQTPLEGATAPKGADEGPWGGASGPKAAVQRSTFDTREDDDEDLFLTGGGKSYLALSGDRWLEDCAEADERKIFVGGLPDVTPAEFASFFEHFGHVADAMVMFDRKRRRQRGFGFITFATNDGVTKALEHSRHPVKGKLVEVKKAHPLVLQKARAPARREREAQQRASPSLTSTKRKASVVVDQTGPPWSVGSRGSAASNGPDPWLQMGKKLRDDQQRSDPFAELNASSRSKFPSAPWNQDVDASRRRLPLEAWGGPAAGAAPFYPAPSEALRGPAFAAYAPGSRYPPDVLNSYYAAYGFAPAGYGFATRDPYGGAVSPMGIQAASLAASKYYGEAPS